MSQRPLIITRHAVATYARRQNDRRIALLSDVGWNLDDVKRVYGEEEALQIVSYYSELEQDIRDCVEAALRDGQALNYKPPGFVLYRRKNAGLPKGQRFVRCDEDSSYGFVVKREPGEGPDIVITTLTKAGVRR